MHICIFFLFSFLSFLPSVEDVLYHEGKVVLCVYGGCKDVVFRWGWGGWDGVASAYVRVCFFFCYVFLTSVLN